VGVDAILFDFAGTLVDGVPNWEHPQIVACSERGQTVTPAQVKAAIWQVWGPLEGCAHPDASVDRSRYTSWIGAIEQQILAKLAIPPDELAAATQRVMELQVSAASYRLFPDVRPTLDALRGDGLRLGLISNFAWDLPDLVRDLGLADYFDLVLTSARAGYRKPRPEIFRQALAALDVAPERAVYVGDDLDCDVAGARGVRLTPILIDRIGRHTSLRPEVTGVSIIASLSQITDHKS
jgi:putative hydrolase of the HAD superfamily